MDPSVCFILKALILQMTKRAERSSVRKLCHLQYRIEMGASKRSQNNFMVNEIIRSLFSVVYCIGVHRL